MFGILEISKSVFLLKVCVFSSLRPVIVEPLESRDEEEGQPEASMHKSDTYKDERKEGPR